MFPWAAFLGYTFVSALTPGPNNIMAMSCAARVGLRKTLPFELGILTGFSLASVLCAVFCAFLSSAIPAVQLPMKILGAIYMLYLAYKIFRMPKIVRERDEAGYGFVTGVAFQFINPKLYVYCIVGMQAYVLPHFAGHWTPVLGFALLLAFIGFTCTMTWAAFGSFFKVLFIKHAKVTSAVMALFLLYCALSLFL